MISKGDVTDFAVISQKSLGSVLIGGDGAPTDNGNLQYGSGLPVDYAKATMENWQKLMKNIASATT